MYIILYQMAKLPNPFCLFLTCYFVLVNYFPQQNIIEHISRLVFESKELVIVLDSKKQIY